MQKKKEYENEVDRITTELAEFVCDELCIYPKDKEKSQEEVEEICAECKMGKFICDICNRYNELANFENSEIKKLLIKKSVLEEEVETLKDRISEMQLMQTL